MTKAQYDEKVKNVTIEDIKNWLKSETIGSWKDSNEPIIYPYAMAALNLLNNKNIPSCNIGDTVYILIGEEIRECKIKSIVIEEKYTTYWYVQKGYVGEWKFVTQSIGKTVFFSEYDAERIKNTQKGIMQ